jgi:hypothetical protein
MSIKPFFNLTGNYKSNHRAFNTKLTARASPGFNLASNPPKKAPPLFPTVAKRIAVIRNVI